MIEMVDDRQCDQRSFQPEFIENRVAPTAGEEMDVILPAGVDHLAFGVPCSEIAHVQGVMLLVKFGWLGDDAQVVVSAQRAPLDS